MAKKTPRIDKLTEPPPTSAGEVLRRVGEEVVSGLITGLGTNPDPQETPDRPAKEPAPKAGPSFAELERSLQQTVTEMGRITTSMIGDAIRQSVLVQTSPQRFRPPKALNRMGPGGFLQAILDNRLTEFGEFEGIKNTIHGLPKAPFLRMEKKAGYPYEGIATEFIDWYFDEFPKMRGQGPIPYYVDLLAWVTALHVEKGFDPPWIDRGLANNLLTFHQGVNPSFFRRISNLEQTARAYYEVFLAVHYPSLADPGIRIMFKKDEPTAVELAKIADETPEPTPESEVKPGPRARRSIELADVIEVGVFRGKREENPNAE